VNKLHSERKQRKDIFNMRLDRLKEMYYVRGMTQDKIAKKIGVSRWTINQFMKRNNLNAKNTRFKISHDAWNKGLSKKIDPRINYNRPTKFTKGNQMWKLRK
jgi:DNA-binding XRE family transcriptional regulator